MPSIRAWSSLFRTRSDTEIYNSDTESSKDYRENANNQCIDFTDNTIDFDVEDDDSFFNDSFDYDEDSEFEDNPEYTNLSSITYLKQKLELRYIRVDILLF
jgi:hypothetical protein